MQSYYYTVMGERSKRLQWVVQFDTLLQLSEFYIKAAELATKTSKKEAIRVAKDYASGNTVELAVLYVDDMEKLLPIALEVKADAKL